MQRLPESGKAGAFKKQIVPISIEEVYVENDKRKTKTHVVDTDEGVRRDTSVEELSKLRAVFKKGGAVLGAFFFQRRGCGFWRCFEFPNTYLL